MKSLTEQIIENYIPKERTQENLPFENSPEIYGNQRIESYKNGFNQARTEMLSKIPEILSLIRGMIKEMPCRAEIVLDNGCNEDGISRDNLLEKLK